LCIVCVYVRALGIVLVNEYDIHSLLLLLLCFDYCKIFHELLLLVEEMTRIRKTKARSIELGQMIKRIT